MPWDTIGNLILGIWKSRKAEKWVKAWMSLILSSLLTGFTVFSSVGLATYYSTGKASAAFVVALFSAAGSIAGIGLALIRKVPQFKGIAIMFPAMLEKMLSDIEARGGTEFDPNERR